MHQYALEYAVNHTSYIQWHPLAMKSMVTGATGGEYQKNPCVNYCLIVH